MTRTRYFLDSEFLEDGATIALISIAFVCEDGRELYRINANAPWGRIERHPWLMENVVPHLAPAVTIIPAAEADNDGFPLISVDYSNPLVTSGDQLAGEIVTFLAADGQGDRGGRELWASHGAYDHVVLCQLWGKMIQLPAQVPMYTNDLMTLRQEKPWVPEPPETAAHNALADARWDREFWVALQSEPPLPRRDDAIAAWLKRSRDAMGLTATEDEVRDTNGKVRDDLFGAYTALDSLLDLYRDHADTGVPLTVDLVDPAFETEGQ